MFALQAFTCDDIASYIWPCLFFNESGNHSVSGCESFHVSYSMSFQRCPMYLKVRGGHRQRRPVQYPLICPQSMCWSFPDLSSREPPQIYESFAFLGAVGMTKMDMQFQRIRKSALMCLGLQIRTLLASLDDLKVRSLTICCDFPLGIRNSSSHQPAAIDECGVQEFMHNVLQEFCVNFICVYMQTVIGDREVSLWCETS